MSHVLPTVKIVNPATAEGYMIINTSDMRDDHELWDAASATDDLRVGKGPRGRFYVKCGKENVAGPFDTEAEALGAMGKP